MSVNANKKQWSIALVWGYILGVILTFFLLPILKLLLYRLLNKPNSIEGMFRIEDLAILFVMLIPIIFVVKRNRSLLKALLYSFIIYSVVGLALYLVALSGSWGGGIGFEIIPYISAIGMVGAFCALMTFLCEKMFLRNKAFS